MTSKGITIWPALAFGGIVILIVAAIFILSHLLGERHNGPGRDEPYESGIKPTGSSRVKYDARYYLVAVFFVLFDVEAAVIIAWAVAFHELRWFGYFGALLFIATLVAGLVYVWKLGGLDWCYTTSCRMFRRRDE